MKQTFSRGTFLTHGMAPWLAVLSATLVAASGLHLIKKIPIPGDYGWDYMTADTEGRRLYLSHDKEVDVIDLDSKAVVGKIPSSDSHGIAVVRDLGRGYISATDPGSVTIFDLKTLAVIKKTPVGGDPNAIIFDRKTRRIFTVDRASHQVSAMDPSTGKVVGTVGNLEGKTEHAASDDAGSLFVNIQDRNNLLKIDTQALKLVATWPLGTACGLPSSMDMDRATERVFIGCRSGAMAVVDGHTGRVITTQPIGLGVDATEFDPVKKLIYFSTGGGDGKLSVFHEDTPDKYTLIESVKTQAGARTMALDRKTGSVYMSVSGFGPVPPASPGNPEPRAPMLPGTFSVIVFGK